MSFVSKQTKAESAAVASAAPHPPILERYKMFRSHEEEIAAKVRDRLNYMGVLLATPSNWKADVFSYCMTPNRPQGDSCQHEMDRATLRAGFELRSWVDPVKDIMQEWTITRWKAETSCPLYGKWAWCDQTNTYERVM
jgi:hypothetical protein